MIEMKDILNLLGSALKDDSEQTRRFREFIEQEKWSTEQIKEWLNECVEHSSGSHDPYNRAFQDLIVSLGRRLGFEIQYGRYVGRQGEENFDGLWKSDDGRFLLLEIKVSTWPIGSVSQLGEYIENFARRENSKGVYGLYVVGKGDLQPLVEQIMGSRFKDRMRVIHFHDLLDLVFLKEDLELIVGRKEAVEKVRQLLFPIESVNVGNLVKLIKELSKVISSQKQAELSPDSEEEVSEGVEKEGGKSPWSKEELIQCLRDLHPHQKAFFAALSQIDEIPAPTARVLNFMNLIAKKRVSLGIQKELTAANIRGARAGFLHREELKEKEDLVETWYDNSRRATVYKIKDAYRPIIEEWAKEENLWVKGEMA